MLRNVHTAHRTSSLESSGALDTIHCQEGGRVLWKSAESFSLKPIGPRVWPEFFEDVFSTLD